MFEKYVTLHCKFFHGTSDLEFDYNIQLVGLGLPQPTHVL